MSSAVDALRVLVVDDDSALIRTLSDILRMHGYSPAVAGTGREGLDVAEQVRPALAVVDLGLPDMNGMELVSGLRRLSELTEVVVLTGNASVESAIAALREHSVDYLLKPVKVEQLMHVISVAGERWYRRQAEQAVQSRARQQGAVASFGQRAIGADDVPELLDEAARLVSETLGTPVVSVLERSANGESLVLRAGVGWSAEDLGKTTVPVVPETQAGRTLLRREPIIIHDLLHDERFPSSVALRDVGAHSGLTVAIPGPAHPYGVLAAHDREARNFTQDDVHFMQAIAHIIGAAVERVRAEAAFRQVQRLEAVGRLAGGVAHDFNNILSAITGSAELARMSLPENAAARTDIDEIIKAAARAAGLTQQLLAFSRQQVLQPRMVNLNDTVTGIEGMLRRLIGSHITLRTRLAADPGLVHADPGQLEQVVLNLCVNARDAMPDGGTLTIETAAVEVDEGSADRSGGIRPGTWVMLAVTDTGIGMSADTRSRMFEPFFTTKPADKGTGLGLPTVYGIVKQSEGEIWVTSDLGQGTTFRIYLPRVAGPGEGPAARPSPERGIARGTETLLLAEDEDAIRRVAKRMLDNAGYQVLVAVNGDDALRVAREHEGPIHLLVTDMLMPGMGGQQLAERLREVRPDLRVLYLSGYADASVNRRDLLANGDSFLQKPFTNEALMRKVRDVLEGPLTHT